MYLIDDFIHNVYYFVYIFGQWGRTFGGQWGRGQWGRTFFKGVEKSKNNAVPKCPVVFKFIG